MKWKIKKSKLNGTITVPSSKSHTIRALLIATLARGESVIEGALLEGDGKSAIQAAEGLGAKCVLKNGNLYIHGIDGDLSQGEESLFLDNSGTSTRLFTSVAALGKTPRTFDGDSSLRTRPMKPLLNSLVDLGATYSILQKNRDIPFSVNGPATGGETKINGITSQYLSSLLLTAPYMQKDTIIHVENLHEKPYVEITLWWLDKMRIRYEVSNNFTTFKIFGNQKYSPINQRIPGDFSSATFGAVAAALTNHTLTIENLDFTDPQGDKEIFCLLENMGVKVFRKRTGAIVNAPSSLLGIVLDLNKMPDALPAFSVLGCVAKGRTEIVNVKQARIKETDRISVMTHELSKMGANIEEKEDGLIIHQSQLSGCNVNGHDDHRVVMALALAGMIADGETIIETAEAADVTYPGFVESFRGIGANIEIIQNK